MQNLAFVEIDARRRAVECACNPTGRKPHHLGKQHQPLAIVAELLLLYRILLGHERCIAWRIACKHLVAHVDDRAVCARTEDLEMQTRLFIDARSLFYKCIELLLLDLLVGESTA